MQLLSSGCLQGPLKPASESQDLPRRWMPVVLLVLLPRLVSSDSSSPVFFVVFQGSLSRAPQPAVSKKNDASNAPTTDGLRLDNDIQRP